MSSDMLKATQTIRERMKGVTRTWAHVPWPCTRWACYWTSDNLKKKKKPAFGLKSWRTAMKWFWGKRSGGCNHERSRREPHNRLLQTGSVETQKSHAEQSSRGMAFVIFPGLKKLTVWYMYQRTLFPGFVHFLSELNSNIHTETTQLLP